MCSSDIVYLSSYFRGYLLGELWRKCGLCRCRPRKGRFNWWNAMFRSRLLDSCGLRCKLAASAIAMNMARQGGGICHSDKYAKEGSRPGIQSPRIPGHEVAGIIDAIGAGVAGWEVGQRVGVGWHGEHCGYCNSCRRGDFVTCSKARQITGLTRDGGYAEFMIASAVALALIPSELSAVEAGPLLCAGVTTFNALRNSGARSGDLVGILGVGGLGHMAIQFSAKMS